PSFAPRRPWHLSPPPCPPASARQCLRLTMSARLSVPATARTMTSPPSPPSPPSGPPLGTYFSRRKLQQPRPPSPPLTKMVTRSINIMRSSRKQLGPLLHCTGSARIARHFHQRTASRGRPGPDEVLLTLYMRGLQVQG